MALQERKLVVSQYFLFFIVIYNFSVWGTSLLLWWDNCVFRTDKLKAHMEQAVSYYVTQARSV